MAKKLGAAACVALSTGNTDPPATWIPLIGARDIKAMRAPGAVFDSSDRTQAVNTAIPTRLKPSLEFDMIWNGGAGMLALRDAFLGGSPIIAAFLDGPPGTSARGMMGNWAVLGFPLEYPLMDGQKVKISMKPHGNGNSDLPFDPNYTDGLTLGTPETPVAKKLGTNASANDASNAPITAFQDIKLNLEPGAAFDSNDRTPQLSSDSNYYFVDMVIPTRMKIGAEANVIWDSNNFQLTSLLEAFLTGAPATMTFLDGPYATSGSWGVHSSWAITDWQMDATLLDGQKIALKFEPHGNGSVLPSFVTIS
jgi:hypothetical protein